MKHTTAAAMFLVMAAATVGVQALDLQGSDTLRSLTTSLISACPGATGALVYKGGGSGAGENAILLNAGASGNLQRIAPMSRYLAGSAPSGGVCAADVSRAEGIEFAGDDIGVWFAEQHQPFCDPGAVSDNCTGYAEGGLSFNKTLSCGVTLTNWKDVLRLVYFGLRPSDFALPTSPADPNAEVSPAAVGRRDCRDSCRDELRNNFGKLFQNECAGEFDTCTKLQHAFRRDENSGTTDFFREALNVEGGANFGSKGFPFCNEFVPRVTQNVGSNTVTASCTPNTATGCSAGYVCNSAGTGCRRPNNGCTVSTSATDCPSGSRCDGGQLQCAKTCTADADCSALGTGARCDTTTGNPGLCVKAVDGCTVNADCQSGFVCDQNTNGGTCSPSCTPGAAGDAACAAYLPGATCGATLSACTRPYGTVCPVPGLVFANSAANPPTFTGTVAGAPGVARSVSFGGVGFENQQDNDLLRWPALGTFSFNLQGVPDNNPAEQVASACGDLGLVLPISLPPVTVSATQLVDLNVFSTTLCGRNKVSFAPATKIGGGLNTRYLLCPNGDMPFGGTWDAATHAVSGGTGNCFYPQQASAPDFRCLNGSNSRPGSRFFPPPIPLPGTPDGRAYNLHLFGPSTAHVQQSYTYNAGAQPPTPAVGDSESVFPENVVSAFYRIHTTRSARPDVDALCPGKEGAPGVCCGENADTQQIGCLVAASPCSLGFSGLSAGTVTLRTADGTMEWANFPVGLNTSATGNVVSPSGPNACIPNGPAPRVQYPIARNLYVNSIEGFEMLPSGDPQLALLKCFSGTLALTPSTPTAQDLISTNGFVNLANYPCCRDFTQDSTCGQPAAANACANNPAGVPSNVCTF